MPAPVHKKQRASASSIKSRENNKKQVENIGNEVSTDAVKMSTKHVHF